MIRTLWVGDAFEKVNVADETTRALMAASIARGWAVFYATASNLVWNEGLRVCASLVRAQAGGELVRMDVVEEPLDRFDYIFLRADPPFDAVYLSALQLMTAHCTAKATTYVNDPAMVSSWVERLAPIARDTRTFVSSDPRRAVEYASRLRTCVVKPLRGANGLGVTIVNDAATNAAEAVEVSLRYSSHVVVQEFLDGIDDGEARVWLAAGTPAAWAKKRFLRGVPVFDPTSGDVLQTYDPTPIEAARAAELSELLTNRGCLLAAVDFISGVPIDVNVTSPGLMVEYQQLTGIDLSARILTLLEEKRSCS